MKKIIGVRFKPAGKIYDFDCGAFVLKIGDHVIVETQYGLGLGTVVNSPRPLEDAEDVKPLKKVYRPAGEKDFEQLEKNREVEQKAYVFCLSCINKLGLKMNLFNVESTFDGGKLTFYFTADGRVDFRQLVKDLVKELSVRIEMRQVGIRNHAKMCGGIGRCGRPICCSAFMESFGPVSIRMAKEQGLSLNPTKISGQCGRLMCCLTFENQTYINLKKGYPKIGKMVMTQNGKGKVTRHNPLQQKIAVQLIDGPEAEFDIEAIQVEMKKEAG
ncbi:MAG: stage 0 sporulation family protein [Desulfobacterales bacterium]